jgi:hypothetical protein
VLWFLVAEHTERCRRGRRLRMMLVNSDKRHRRNGRAEWAMVVALRDPVRSAR